MKKIEDSEEKLLVIVSEPGDCTRYDYYCIVETNEVFKFLPRGNTFKYPEVIEGYQAKDIYFGNDDLAIAIAKKYVCNVCTVRECARTIMTLLGEEF